MPRGGDTKGDIALREAGLTRNDLARFLGVTPQRAGQICRGEGAGYELADKVARYINRAAGRPVCGCDEWMVRPKYRPGRSVKRKK
jgi:transcriptional regulator with XRE-family HTH domain